MVVGRGGEQGGSWLTSPPHRPFPCDGCTNCGLMKEKFANSAWSMLAMTSSSGGVSWGWVRVKNLSKFSAPLPHWKRERKGESVGRMLKDADAHNNQTYLKKDQTPEKKHPPRDPRPCRVGLNSIWATTRCALTAPRSASRPSRASWPTYTHLILSHVQQGSTNTRLHAPHLIHLKHRTAKQR